MVLLSQVSGRALRQCSVWPEPLLPVGRVAPVDQNANETQQGFAGGHAEYVLENYIQENDDFDGFESFDPLLA